MKKLFIALCAALFCFSAFAVDYTQEFNSLLMSGEYDEAKALVEKWESEDPKNYEINIAWFNYYLNVRTEVRNVMGPMKDGRYGLYPQPFFNDEDMVTAQNWLGKALKINNKRLDVHFGRISSYLKADKYEEASKAIVEMINVSKKIKNQWYWTADAPLYELLGVPKTSWTEAGADMLFSGLNDYIVSYLYAYSDTTSPWFKSIVDAEVKNYPDNTWGLNHAARYYQLSGDLNETIKLLEKACKLDPTDYVVYGNLGLAYEEVGRLEDARKVYVDMCGWDNADAKAWAEESVRLLDEKEAGITD